VNTKAGASSGSLSSELRAARLKKPVRLSEQVWPEWAVPVVSIFCITYSHEKFIRDAIEGFLMQETTFPVEVFIHDDASTDGTADIVRKYQAKHPSLFRSVLQTENQYAKNGFQFLFEHLRQLRGEFVALCEGDDRWISPSKLESQVRLLEANPQASGCFHLARVADEKGNRRDTYPPREYRRGRTLEDIYFNYWLPTCSLVFRASAAPCDFSWAADLAMGDVPLLAELCSRGPLLFVEEVAAVYRQHSGGVWSNAGSEQKIRSMIQLYNRAEKRFGSHRLPTMQKARKRYYAQLFGVLVERNAFREAWICLARYLTTSPSRGPLLKTQKSNLLRLCTFGALK
jgi:glycosyltransferase involved in cell wall biosynthesis